MPDEALIVEMENILAEVIELGGQSERTSIVPNLLITDNSPTGLTGFVTIKDNRDGDNILAKTVPGLTYAINDFVNVIFPKGGEAIAFQQGSQSPSSGLWAVVPGTTDIFYNQGDVGIGKSVAPDAALEILDAAQAQLRLTFQEDTKFADFTVDTNHDLTIKPSGTGQIILQPTTDQTNSVQILDADGGTPVFNADLVNERIGIGTATPGSTGAALLELEGPASSVSGPHIQIVSDTDIHPLIQYLNFAHDNIQWQFDAYFDGDQRSSDPGSNFRIAKASDILTADYNSGTAAGSIFGWSNGWTLNTSGEFSVSELGVGTTVVPHGGVGGGIMAIEGANASVASGPHIQVTTASDDFPLIQYLNFTHDNIQWQFDAYFDGAQKSSDAGSNFRLAKGGDKFFLDYNSGTAAGSSFSWTSGWTLDTSGNFGIGIASPTAKAHVDQASTTAAIPVLTLDQADISEEMIEFVSTIGVGNAIEAVGAKVLTTTHFIKVTLPGALTRYIPCGTIA